MKKSKFLKKSLAMLLALMLVVAMIPLSASASAINLDSIYVDGNKVKIDGDSFSVGVYTTAKTVEVDTNEDLSGWTGNEHQLRVVEPDSLNELPVDQWDTDNDQGTGIDLDTYMVDGKVTFKLYDMTTNKPTGKLEKTITMNVTRTQANTQTDLASVKPGTGVYEILNSLEEINETKTIKVLVARNFKFSSSTEDQDDLQATIFVTAANGATLQGVTDDGEANANEGDSFEVKSASGTNVSKFTVEAEYLDALESFTITGLDGVEYTATPVDTNQDDIPDTINVVLPDKAIVEAPWGDTITEPELKINYAVNGNLEDTLTINRKAYKNGDKLKLVGLTTDAGYSKSVIVTRLSADASVADNKKAEQEYTLKVSMEKSSSTAIKSIQVNNTMVEDLTTDPIAVELPKTYYSAAGNKENTDTKNLAVTITTDPTVTKVVLNGKEADGPKKGALNSDKSAKTWDFTDVDLSAERILSVFAEDGTTMTQTGIVATVAEDVSSASITSFYLKDEAGNTYDAESISNNEILVRVPYMTTNVGTWTMFATPSAYSKVVGAEAYTTKPGPNGSMDVVLTNPIDVMNGSTTASAIDLDNIAAATSKTAVASEGRIQAVSKNDDTIKTTYTVKVILETAKNGKLLQGVDFTVQSYKNTQQGDKIVYRSKTTANTFHANVDQATNGSMSVGEINLEIAPSLTNGANGNDLGITYENVVTGFQAQDGAVVYVVKERTNLSLVLDRLTATTNDDSSKLTGKKLVNYSNTFKSPYTVGTAAGNGYAEIVVLPEQYARQLELGQLDSGNQAFVMQTSQLTGKGLLYDVVLNKKTAETEAELKTIKIGDVSLTINADKTITGTLPWSYTVKENTSYSDAKFAEFTMSDYALLSDKDDRAYFSKGDWNGDGKEDPIGHPVAVSTFANRKFLFVRDTSSDKVIVYAATDSRASALVDSAIIVKGENRLTDTEYSSTTYTFELKYAQPSNETVISNFKLGKYTGTVNGHNITVNVPYGTDVTGLIATFDKSLGSTIKVNDRVGGVDLVSGVTSVNYTNPVKLYVTSESGNNTVEYTVTVEQGMHFSDISENDWYYENVMDAANNGYVSGMGDGTFAPKKATTRAEFAAMIANAMGYESDPDVNSMFPDVADDFWGKAAINFCAQNGIISGYEDGTFQPNKAITRQEAAAILNNAFELAERYGTSSDLYSDNGKIAGWAADHVYAAKAAGLMKGDAGTGMFRPTDTIIRAEAASILMHANREGLIK